MKHVPRLLFIIFLLLLAACAPPVPVSPAAQSAQSTPAPVKLTVCLSALGSNFSPLQYAVDKGLFQQYGLDVDVVTVDGGTTAATAMIADEFGLCLIAGSPIASAVVAGEDLRIISGLANVFDYSLYVDPSIKTVDDLKGKALAVSDPGSSSDTALRVALSQLGLEPDKDVTILAVGGQSERLAAVLAGAVQGTLVSAPQTATARDEGLVELYDLGKLGIPFQHSAIAATTKFLDEQPEAAKSFLRAIITAVAQMQTDETGAKEALARLLELDPVADAHLLDEAYQKSVLGYLTQGPYPTLEGIRFALDQLAADNPKAAEVQPEDVVDMRVLDALKQEGFLDNVGQ